MRSSIVNVAIAASFAAGAAAQPHHHIHHHHKKNDRSPVEKRDVETTYVPATVTQYVLGDEPVSPEEAKAGLEKGLFIVVGETTPTFTPPPPPAVTSTSSKADAVFIQKVTTSSSVPPTTSSSAAPVPTSSSTDYSTGATGIDADFPSGKIKCSTFPSDYGAVALPWLGLGGWSGLQFTPDYKLGDLAISFIETGVAGMAQKSGFYSYACPEGYVKTQWPAAQGATLQSVGGLLCNADGYLELSRPSYKKLCEPGVSGITIQNDMKKNVAICRTDYPGSESMVIPVDAQPGSTRALANVQSAQYYKWDGKDTTLQYYVNQPGVSVEDGCVWDCDQDHDECGNWAPTIIGVGEAADGNTYISIFPNKPTSVAKPRMNIEILGDVSIPCYFKNGEYAIGENGCTTTIPKGGKAVVKFSDA
ncbi:SUN-domain-containing protein [Durotheca rogersii]|uniref:SUN-domain-containing protein n=1 Tax=Durotheca rogersii TaxID=419775 RepID=UPI00221EA2EC|nr:SUN-domain-containing protein [Durotheca rogersii]KAI5861818.1 SUN-domain-containing protein [Durotheca rogersii]